LGAVACFFEERWKRLAPALPEDTQAWLLNQAAVCLRALGRLTEALEPMRVSTEMGVAREKWTDAAISASNLSELELTLGEVAAAVRDAEQSVDFAERSGDAVWRMRSRTALADALHQAGRRTEALECFREAEAMQAERQPHFPLLFYSLQGFQYCDLLLSEAERAAWQRAAGYRPAGVSGEDDGITVIARCCKVERAAAQTLRWAEQHAFFLDIALDHLTLGRVALYRTILDPAAERASGLATARQEFTTALDGLRHRRDYFPHGLLSLAWLRFLEGDPEGARADLDDAWEIAERGLMRLHMADILLTRARLFRDKAALSEARKLIEQCSYWRRKDELEDAEDATQHWK
jgi:tetratricopeptide (TPR) repeat protein